MRTGRGLLRLGAVCVLVALLLLASLAGLWFVWYPHERPSLRSGETYGIDVSHHQGEIDWRGVASDGIAFTYIKASEGGTVADARFRENWRGADDAGLRRGAYHFFTLCRSGAEQAAHFLRTAPPERSALPPAVDLELGGNCAGRPSRKAVTAELDAFLGAVERAWGRDAVLYVGEDWEDHYPLLARSRRPHWLVSLLGRPGPEWTVWQVHWRARVDGVSSPVDLDVGRLGDLRAGRLPAVGERR
jgi:lysozyme